MPLAPDVTPSHAWLLETVHGHPAGADTATDDAVAAPPTVIEIGLRFTVHTAPACDTVMVSPEIVTVPVRLALPVFAATV